MEIKAHVLIEVRDTKTGRLVRRRRFRSRSYVKAFLYLLYGHQRSSGGTIKDTGGTDRSISLTGYSFDLTAPANDDTYGVVIGTDDTAVDIDDYALAAQIAHGTGSGEMEHGIVEFTAPTKIGTSYQYVFRRSFANNSGASITVKECGLYMWATTLYYCFCQVRDVISAGVAVANGQSILVQYTQSITV